MTSRDMWQFLRLLARAWWNLPPTARQIAAGLTIGTALAGLALALVR